MGFLCKTEENKYLDNPINRDLGLSNIFNVNSTTNFCLESFNAPNYTISGATKAITGSTGNLCVYNNWEIPLSGPCTYELYDCNGDVYDTVSFSGAGTYYVCSVTIPGATSTCSTGLITNVGTCSTEFTPCSGTPTNCYGIYNLSEIDDFNLIFNLSGSTSYTGYSGSFCYKIFNRTKFTTGQAFNVLNNVDPIYENCVSFSAITGNSFTEILSVGQLPQIDNDYLLRGYYIFTPQNCQSTTFNTWLGSIQPNSFNMDTDWYFMTVTNPPIPTLVTDSDVNFRSISLVQEIILGKDYQNYFNLKNYPIDNKIDLYVNGIKLTQDLDFLVNVDDFPSVTPVIEILDANIESTDIITITYLFGEQSFLTNLGDSRTDFFQIDTFFVTGFTTGVTSSTINIVNENTVKGTQEVFLTKDFDEFSDITVVLNGIKLAQDIEYYKSSTVKNKIIFNPNFTTIKTGDILSFWYFKSTLSEPDDLGTLDKNNITINWSATELNQPEYNTGNFNVQVTELTDTNWSSLFYDQTFQYEPNLDVYSAFVDNLLANRDYKFRIIFNKIYKNILGEDITTSSEKIGYFNTKNDKINYGY